MLRMDLTHIVTGKKSECGPAQPKFTLQQHYEKYLFHVTIIISFWLSNICLVVSVLMRDVLDNEQ